MAVVSYYEVLVNRLGGLSLLRKSVVRLTDRPNMTLDVYRGRKTTIQPTNSLYTDRLFHCYMLGESICHFRGLGSVFFAFILFLMENHVSKQCRPGSDATLCGI